ncbi:MAG: DNA-3-methyladenine glycosylase I [Porticoccaceae bacterium]
MSADLKKRGVRFFGSTICYAHMQAMGMVNDHATSCFRHAVCRQLGQANASA